MILEIMEKNEKKSPYAMRILVGLQHGEAD